MNAHLATQGSKNSRSLRPRNHGCTLYQLVEAICDETQPDEDRLVTEAVLDLFCTGRIRFHRSKTQLLV